MYHAMDTAKAMETTAALQLMHPGRRCHATNRAGSPCGNRALPGMTVCRMHGGSTRHVRAKAAERVALVRDLAIDRLLERLEIDGGHVDPKVLLDCVVKLGGMVELLEGRATGRTESITSAAEEGALIRERLQGALDEMASRRGRRQDEEEQKDQ